MVIPWNEGEKKPSRTTAAGKFSLIQNECLLAVAAETDWAVQLGDQ